MSAPASRRLAATIAALAVAALALWALFPRPAGEVQIEFAGPVMGTSYTVKVVSPPAKLGEAELKRRVEEALHAVNSLMSTYDPDSELSRFNRYQGTDWFAVSDQTRTVVAAALEIGTLSGGAFDVTVGPLVNLWGFGPDGPANGVPPAAALAQARERVGHAKLAQRREPPALRKIRADVYVDLSAIAKGFAVDLAANSLETAGVANYLLEVGGEMRARGHNAVGGPWRVAVEKPLVGERSVQRVLELRDTAVATSGDYRNYFLADGTRFSHTIDPRSGYPVSHDLASVTVLHESAMRADALATALLVMGPEDGLEFARRADLAALLIVRSGDAFEERTTPRLKRLVNS